MILSTTNDPADGVTSTPLMVTTYEGGSESSAVLLQPINGQPRIVIPGGISRHRANTGTWVLVYDNWPDARDALELLRGYRSDTVFLHGDERGLTTPVEVLPQRVNHRVIPEELDMHEVTVEWTQVGGTY